MYDIITIGSATRDVFFKLPHSETRPHSDSPTGIEQCFPLGSKLGIKNAVFTTGGGGTNTAVTFARQGLKTACISAIGNDLNGKEIIAELEQENVKPIFQIDQDGITAYSVILVHENGERTILSYKGEGQHFEVQQIAWNDLEAQWLYLDSLGGHYDLLEQALRWAKEHNVKVATNPGGKELAHGLKKLEPLLEYTSVVILNQEEASQLLEMPINREEEIFRCMDELVPGIFIITKGHNGVIVSDGKNRYVAGVPDSPIVERTGAGDAFSAGFVAEYIRSGNIEKAIQFATANASSVVTKVGAKAGILKKNDRGPWPLVEVIITTKNVRITD